jgi:predicted NBD/HSP70 family sugar kinase
MADVTADVGAAPVETEQGAAPGGRYLGVDIGGTSIKWSVLRGGAVESSGSIDTPRIDQHAVLRAVADLAHDASQDLAGIGVAVPGTVDTERRRSMVVPNLPGDWHDFAFASELEHLTGLRVAFLNDARAVA